MRFDLYAAKAEKKLKNFADNTFDSSVHDGPYGIRFMGKAWDSFDITKRAADRDSYQLGRIREASGRKADGFGASVEAGKYNQSNQSNQLFQQFTTDISREVYRVLKPGAYFLSFCSTRTFHRLVCGIEDAGFEIRDTMAWVFASGFPKSHNLDGEFEGWGSALKPAYEPIVMARKPLDGTIAQNMAKWGTGAININASRIAGEPWVYGTQPKINNNGFTPGTDRDVHAHNVVGGESGRWPANLMHDGSPEVLSVFPDSKGQMGDVKGTEPSNTGGEGTVAYGKFNRVGFRKRRNDEGSAARFFYSPKTSRADRNEGCEHLQSKPLLWSSGSQNPGSFQSEGTDKSSPNNHPTVKPTELMRYLVKMVTPKGGLCLDHMCGSGSTGKACALEDINFVGIDEDPHNIEIARCRIQYILDHQDLFGHFSK